VTAAAGARPARATGRIEERLRAISTEHTPDESMHLALQALREEFGTVAAAFCLFDPRRRALRLAAEVGLSDEGCRQLRSAKENVPVGWDIPLHSLLNRRVYLIDSASRNRYVPPLVDGPTSIGTVACFPVYAGEVPIGSLLLITRAPKRLDERDVLALRPALRALAILTHDLRRRAGDLWAASLAS
jgi:GAF domain-containing protein